MRVCSLLLATIGILAAQNSPKPTFEVASIRPSDPNAFGGYTRFFSGGQLDIRKTQMIFMIQQLYGLRDFQIVGAPKWITDWSSSRFNIEAKAEHVTDDAQLRLMGQALLEDRFKLKMHHEMRELSVYFLTVSKGGTK